MSVGALITWPYKAGGRSRRVSPKAGTTVLLVSGHSSTCMKVMGWGRLTKKVKKVDTTDLDLCEGGS